MTGTGEVDDDEINSEDEELEKGMEKEEEVDEDEPDLAPNYKPARISEELAALGYYARSMKPPKGWLSERESLQILDNSSNDVLI